MTDEDSHKISAEIKKAFEEAQPSEAPCMTGRQIVQDMLPEILRKKAAGLAYKKIHADLVRIAGFQGTLSTLYSYVERLSREERERQRQDSEASVDTSPSEPEPETMSDPSMATNPVVHPHEISSEIPLETPPRRRVAEALCTPEQLARIREQKQKKGKPKLTMIEMVNKRV